MSDKLKATIKIDIDKKRIDEIKNNTECNLKVKASCVDKTKVNVELLDT